MDARLLLLGTLLLPLSACEPTEGPAGEDASQADVGEPVSGFPSWEERVLHVYVNRARAAPSADLAGCQSCGDAACHAPTHPLEWRESLAKSARFHATNLTSARCGMIHDSPCPLVSGIGTAYPATCGGAVSCACVGGAATCGGTANTGIWSRFDAFGTTGGYRAENVAGHPANPVTTFYQWFWESSTSTACAWTTANGHRFNILDPNLTHIGDGADGSYTVQDFWGKTVTTQRIPAGAHTPRLGPSVELRASWYASAAPRRAMVNVGGTCQSMTLERGTSTNGTYLRAANVGTGCVDYYFWFEDGAGVKVTYPTTGAFGIGCAYDWTATRPTGTAECTSSAGSSSGSSSSSSSGSSSGSNSSSSSSGGSSSTGGGASGGCSAASGAPAASSLLAGVLAVLALAARARRRSA